MSGLWAALYHRPWTTHSGMLNTIKYGLCFLWRGRNDVNYAHNELIWVAGNSVSSLRLNTAKYFFPPNLATFIPSSVSSNIAFTEGSLADTSSSGSRSKYGWAVHLATCQRCSSSTSAGDTAYFVYYIWVWCECECGMCVSVSIYVYVCVCV